MSFHIWLTNTARVSSVPRSHIYIYSLPQVSSSKTQFLPGDFTYTTTKRETPQTYPLSVYNIIHRLRNNASSSSRSRRCDLLSSSSSSINSFLFPPPLPQRRALFRPRFMKWYFVQFHFSVRLDLLAPGWTRASSYSGTFYENVERRHASTTTFRDWRFHRECS